MATLHPFRALRPVPGTAARIAAVPYDVVNTEEARALERGLPRRQYIADRNAAAAGLLSANGYVVTHRYWRMVCDLDGDPGAARYPEGVILRQFRLGVDDLEVHALVQAAFSEIEGNIAYAFDPWRVRSIESSSFDPAWWFIAAAEGRIVGVSLSEVWESDGIGWVGQLAVAPEWRGAQPAARRRNRVR